MWWSSVRWLYFKGFSLRLHLCRCLFTPLGEADFCALGLLSESLSLLSVFCKDQKADH